MSWIVYRATSPSGKIYVGITSSTMSRRRSNHFSAARRGKDTYFCRALRKYGSAIKWEVLERGLSENEANEMEAHYILVFESHLPQNGYNRTMGGDGVRATPETKAKMRAAKLGTKRGPHTLDTRRRISASLTGTKKSPSARLRMSDAAQGRRLSDERKAALSKHWKGREFSDEHRAKISAAKKKAVQRSDGELFASVRDAAEAVGVSPSAVQRAIKKGWRSGGYSYEFLGAT